MNKIVLGFAVVLGSGAATGGVLASRRESVVRPNTFVGPIGVGGLTREAAAKKLRIWWESEKLDKLTLKLPERETALGESTPGKLGVVLDDIASVAQLPFQDVGEAISSAVGATSYTEPFRTNPVFRSTPADLKELAAKIRAVYGPPKRAQVRYEAGQIVRTPEVPTTEFDSSKLYDSVLAGLTSDRVVTLPIKQAEKQLPDSELEKITDVIGEFSTRFPAYQTSRNANIRLASSRLDGAWIMPGQRLSFNNTVGRRTVQQGYQIAGVYKNGRHDTGIGGGICQVSTTLYNSALFANMKIVRRSNHSIPVAYVPVGRDATVDFGSIDFVFENTTGAPVVVNSVYQPGKLTFRLLGQKDPGLSVKVAQSEATSWDIPSKTVIDKTLRPGTRKMIEKGSRGHRVKTFRRVFKDGVLVRTEPLGESYYGGGPKIFAVGPGAPASSPSSVRPPSLPSGHRPI